MYDHLSEKFCVCDRWFSSVAGSTFPNRLYALAGRGAGKRVNEHPPIYHLPSFVRHLDGVKGVSWATFVHVARSGRNMRQLLGSLLSSPATPVVAVAEGGWRPLAPP